MVTSASEQNLARPRASLKDRTHYFLLFGLIASVSLFNWLRIDVGYFTIRALDIALISFVFAAAVTISINPTIRKLKHSVLWIPLFLYLGYMALIPFLGLLFRDDFDFSHVSFGARYGFIFVFCVALIILSPPSKLICTSLRRSLLLVGYPVLTIALGQILEYAHVLPGGFFLNPALADTFSIKIDHHMRPPGTFTGPNQLGWYGAVIFIISFCFYLTGSEARWAHVSLVHFLIIVASTSRSALLAAFFVATLIYTLTSLRTAGLGYMPNIKNIALPVVVALSFPFLILAAQHFGVLRPQSVYSAFAVVTGDLHADGSLTARFDGWANSIKAFHDYGFFGFLGDPRVITGTIDSGWLNYLVRGGIPLLTLFCLFLITTTFYTIFVYLKSGNRYALALLGVTLTIPLGFIPLSAFHYTHVLIYTLLVFYMFASNPLPRKM